MKNIIMDSEAITRAISRISNEILERNQGTNELVIVGIFTRGYYLAERIQKKIYDLENVNIPLYSLDITQYRDDIKKSTKRQDLHYEYSGNIDGKVVILVDDVIYTGRTVRAALDALMEHDRPRKVQLVGFIDRGHRELPIRGDYVGKNVPTAKSEKIVVNLTEVDDNDQVLISE